VTSPDVLVVGGGVVGVAATLELARRGLDVMLLEAGDELGAGCSSGNAGLVCPSHATPLATRSALAEGSRSLLRRDGPLAIEPRLSLLPWLLRFAAAATPARERTGTGVLRGLTHESLALHERLSRELGTGVERRGTLNLYETSRLRRRGEAEAREHARAGLRVELLGPRDVRALEPAVTGDVAGGVYYPDELSGDPLQFVRVVARAAQSAGATIRTAVKVTGFEVRDGAVASVETTEGRLAPQTVVVAAGAWSGTLVRDLGLRLYVEGAKGYHVEFPAAPDDPSIPLFLQEARVVLTSLPGRLRLTGVLELSSLESPVHARRVATIEAAGKRVVTDLADRRPQRVWQGFRACAPDGLPIVGRPRRLRNVIVATAHSMLGFTLAPVTAEQVADLVLERPLDDVLGRLDPDRFTRKPRGRVAHMRRPEIRRERGRPARRSVARARGSAMA
jgi:D-amino-acid dehydrogenase